VFPAPPGAKKSYKSGKQHGGARWGATKDPAEIECDWKRWPNANVGLPTDAANGFFVVEADTREGHPKLGDQDGLATLAALEREFGPLPDTLQAESPSGSRHRYFRHPVGDPIRSKDGWRHGIDIKGEGGMVIAPPSRKGDKAYRWVNQLPIAEAPHWLLDLIQEGRERVPNGAAAMSAGASDGLSAELLDEMAADAEQGVSDEPTPAEKIRLALAVIPPTSREDRINFGRALHRWSGGSEQGKALFAEWLCLSDAAGKQWWPDFVGLNMRRVWDSFKEVSPPEQIITIASIFGRANEMDPTWRDRWGEVEYRALVAQCAQTGFGEAGEENDGLGSKGADHTPGDSKGGDGKGGDAAGSGNGGNGQGGNGAGNGAGNGGNSGGAGPQPSSEPKRAPYPLPDSLLPVAQFDFDLLPEGLRAWGEDIYKRMQCPPDFVGIAMMTALGSLNRPQGRHPPSV
jgi:hypothetical protein